MFRKSFALAVLLLGATLATTGNAATTVPPDKIGADEHVIGSAKAPVTMIEYFSQGCSVCARFNQEVFPQLKAKYIDTGKVRYVMRLFPLFPIDGPSYKLDLCVPPDQFFKAADLLFRNQPQWDNAEFPVADPHAGLIAMAGKLGLSPAKADACMKSTKLDAAINDRAQDGMARYQINGTPTLVINYQKAELLTKTWAFVQPAIEAALAAKGVK